MQPTKILLDENDLPSKWYNVQADLLVPPEPVLHPATHQPVAPEDLTPLFPTELIKQEVSTDRWIDIPLEVRDVYRLWRPTPLYRAHRLEKYLKTPAKIYYKWEGVSPPGSHKPNTAVAQAYYNSKAGIQRLATETGAGQWGSSLAFATSLFNLECTVYMVRVSYQQKPYRKSLMRVWGAECIPSPSKRTKTGCAILEKNPETSGSLGIAISEAVEDAASHGDTNYSLGSVLNHVCLHQTIIGLETQQQFLAIDDYPDIVMGCCGGGSNFAGMAFPFVGDKIRKRHPEVRILSCEPAACPTLTKGLYTYDFGDAAGLTPLLKMYTLGHDFVPPPIHAGGLRYHGDSPLLCQLTQQGIMEAKSFHQTEVFDAAQLFAHTEGLIVAPEAAHAVKGVVEEALICKKTGKDKTILFNNSGHGSFDLSSYDAYLDGQLVDYEYPESLVQEAMGRLPQLS